ncbi:cytochrome c oxidase subunit VIb [Aspergillus affinis]|uniref:cytochrome c oxidase subunit VIb n=1 Tax=Aspergillus affinis TaxID=1070780 RepID=UPI0022FF21C2|nr:uncharacterized protein KD926_001891 [Aspergillus affinis]KAI9044068.1 hypothetical protein KD926_001891 [Aspergillus affinis]
MSGSLDRPRSLPASLLHGSFHSTGRKPHPIPFPFLPLLPSSTPTTSPPPRQFNSSYLSAEALLLHIVKMGAIPEADPDEVMETKPFKFLVDRIALNAVVVEDFLWRMDELVACWMLTIRNEMTGYDARFPQMNQTKHCWQNYVDYYKCVNAKGEDFRPCTQFFHAFRSLCPKAWTDRWDGQREAGNFPAKLE